MNSSIAMWPAVPVPPVPYVSLPRAALALVTSSATEFTPSVEFTTSISGTTWVSETGAKSLMAS